MRMQLPISIALIAASLLLPACTATRAERDLVPVDEVRTRVSTIQGKTCPIFEDEIYTLGDKSVLDDCDLKSHANLLDGKLVRVRSRFWLVIHGPILVSRLCGQTSDAVENIAVEWQSSVAVEKVILDDLKSNPVDISAIGRFTVVRPTLESDSTWDNSPYHFEIACLEQATVPKDLSPVK